MEGLFVFAKDCDFGAFELAGIIQCADLDDDLIESGSARNQMGSAGTAKFVRHWRGQIIAGEFARPAFGVAECPCWHQHKVLWRAACEMLAGAAMALCPQHGFACAFIAKRPAITSTNQPHD